MLADGTAYGSVEDNEAALRILEGALHPPAGTPGLSLHELRQCAAMAEMGWTASAREQFMALWNDGRPN